MPKPINPSLTGLLPLETIWTVRSQVRGILTLTFVFLSQPFLPLGFYSKTSSTISRVSPSERSLSLSLLLRVPLSGIFLKFSPLSRVFFFSIAFLFVIWYQMLSPSRVFVLRSQRMFMRSIATEFEVLQISCCCCFFLVLIFDQSLKS